MSAIKKWNDKDDANNEFSKKTLQNKLITKFLLYIQKNMFQMYKSKATCIQYTTS